MMSGSVDDETARCWARLGAPDAIPVAIFARLAVCRERIGRGLGADALSFMLEKADA